MYIANHYVSIDRVYAKGEIIPDIPADKIEWLLSTGAISVVEGKVAKEVTEEVPEIDAMDGIVQDNPEPKKSGRKKK